MSSSDDSETAEWEREQMLRGTQSRSRPQNAEHQQHFNKSQTLGHDSQTSQIDVIDASLAKKHVKLDIEKVERDVESIKRNMGSTRLDMVRSDKRIDAIKKRVELLESSTPLFVELSALQKPQEVLEFLNKNKTIIARLPPDQKEMLESLSDRYKESDSMTQMEIH